MNHNLGMHVTFNEAEKISYAIQNTMMATCRNGMMTLAFQNKEDLQAAREALKRLRETQS